MEKLELLRAEGPYLRVNFISILKPYTSYSTKELSEIYDNLCNGRKAMIELLVKDHNIFNDLVLELADMGVHIGESSFHEEKLILAL